MMFTMQTLGTPHLSAIENLTRLIQLTPDYLWNWKVLQTCLPKMCWRHDYVILKNFFFACDVIIIFLSISVRGQILTNCFQIPDSPQKSPNSSNLVSFKIFSKVALIVPKLSKLYKDALSCTKLSYIAKVLFCIFLDLSLYARYRQTISR